MHIEDVAALAPVVQQLFTDVCSVYVADEIMVLAALNHPKLDLGVKVGTPMEQLSKTLSYRVVKERKRMAAQIDKEHSIFGIPYAAVGVPIWDGNTFIGGITVVSSVEKLYTLVEMGERIQAASEEYSQMLETLSASSEEFAANTQAMSENTQHAEKAIEEIKIMSSEIKKMSAQINILGLNASIEAARASEAGRGFAVVADEVRKLGESVRQSAAMIEGVIKDATEAMSGIILFVGETAVINNEQAKGISELLPAINDLRSMADQLVRMGKG